MRTDLKQTDYSGSFISHGPLNLPPQTLWELGASRHPHSCIKSKEVKSASHGASLVDRANNNAQKLHFASEGYTSLRQYYYFAYYLSFQIFLKDYFKRKRKKSCLEFQCYHILRNFI